MQVITEGEDEGNVHMDQIEREILITSESDQKEKESKEIALRQAVDNNSSSVKARYELAEFLFNYAEFNEAQSTLLPILEINNQNVDVFCLLGQIYKSLKDYHKSQEYFKRALQLDCKNAKTHARYGKLLYEDLQLPGEAELHYKQAIKLKPNNVSYMNDYAIMLVNYFAFREAQARVLYENILELEPDHAIAHFNLANLLRKQYKDNKAAEKHFIRAIQIRPTFLPALNNYATFVHYQFKRYTEAEEYYLKALEINPKYHRCSFNYANLCREHLKKYDVSEQYYLKAIENHSKNANYYNNYGLLLQYAFKKLRKAKKQYEIALKLTDQHSLAHCNYGTILVQLVVFQYNKEYNEHLDTFKYDENRTYHQYILSEEWKTEFEEGKNENNDDEKYNKFNKERMSVYSAAYSSKKTEYFAKAEWHLKYAIHLDKSLAMAYNNYGILLKRLGKFNEAKTMFLSALAINPNFLMAKRNLERLKPKQNTNPVVKPKSKVVDKKGKKKDDNCIVM